MHRNIAQTLRASIRDGTKKIRAKRTKKKQPAMRKQIFKQPKGATVPGRARDIVKYLKRTAAASPVSDCSDASKVCWKRDPSSRFFKP